MTPTFKENILTIHFTFRPKQPYHYQLPYFLTCVPRLKSLPTRIPPPPDHTHPTTGHFDPTSPANVGFMPRYISNFLAIWRLFWVCIMYKRNGVGCQSRGKLGGVGGGGDLSPCRSIKSYNQTFRCVLIKDILLTGLPKECISNLPDRF